VEPREAVTNIKVTSSNNNNNKHRSNLGTKYKAQNHTKNIKREEKQIHQEMFTYFDPTMTYYGGDMMTTNCYITTLACNAKPQLAIGPSRLGA